MSETPAVPPVVNRTMKFILTSPLHGLVSQSILLISFMGRTSGKTYTTPVSYSQDADQITIFTHAAWWKNLRGGQQVRLHLRGQVRQGLAWPVTGDLRTIADALVAHLKKVPGDARYYQVTFDEHGNPRPDQIEEAVKSVVMIRVRLC